MTVFLECFLIFTAIVHLTIYFDKKYKKNHSCLDHAMKIDFADQTILHCTLCGSATWEDKRPKFIEYYEML
jgi:hypothetical protein